MLRYLHVIVLFVGFNVQSQELSVELSVEWKGLESENTLLLPGGDTVTTIPFLKVTYRNNTAKNIYFKKPIPSKNGYPPVVGAAIIQGTIKKEEDILNAYLNSTDPREEYNVYFWQNIWGILEKYKNPGEENESASIQNNVSFLNDIFLVQDILNDLEVNKQLIIFNHPDKDIIDLKEAREIVRGVYYSKIKSIYISTNLSEETILGEHKEEFVFLKGGEVEMEYINLVSFYLVQGAFHFRPTETSLKRYMRTKDGEVFFPERIGRYNLYTGGFKTNHVGVDFEY